MDSTFTDNSADFGGGVYTYNSPLVNLVDSRIESNTAATRGGGIYVGGSVSLVGVTIAHNNSGEGGGLFKSGGGGDTSTATLTNSTVSNNNATTGGGISNFGNLVLKSVTVTANTATDGGGIANRSWLPPDDNGSISAANSIIAGNTATGADPDVRSLHGTHSVPFTSLGNNLIGKLGTGVGFTDGVNGDIVGTIASPINAMLSPLQDNGGLTFTHAPLPGSPAIDAGSVPVASGTDQRGVPRTIDGDGNATAIADIGAVERVDFVVDSTLDTVDATPGDGVALDAAGKTTLRAAIMEANALGGPQTIVLLAGTYTFSLTGAIDDDAVTGDLDIKDDVTIVGVGAASTIIDAADLDRVFEVMSGKHLSIERVTIRNGNVSGGADGGGILNSGTLELTRVTLDSNEAASIGGQGGAIYNQGSLTVSDALFTNNTGNQGGGGLYNGPTIGPAVTASITNTTFDTNNTLSAGGGAIYNSDAATLDVTSGTFANNAAPWDGGAIQNAGGSVTISGSLIHQNTINLSGDGGGLSNEDDGVMTVTNSTISDNTANNGGGIRNVETASLTIVNTTISGNSVTFFGGGIVNQGSATLTLSNATISGNQAPGSSGGGIWNNATVDAQNTLIAANTATNGRDIFDNGGTGTFNSLGHNLIGVSDGASGFTNGVNGDIIGSSGTPIDAMLGPLQDNGGPTLTHNLLPGSPAIDAGSDADAPATDQRGVFRPQDGNGDGTSIVDIGAVERIDFYVNTTADTIDANLNDGLAEDAAGNTSLRAAIMEANALAGLQTIFVPVGTYTLTLTGTGEDMAATGDLDILDDLGIIGAGAVETIIDASDLDRVFEVHSGKKLSLEAVTLRNGWLSGGADGAGILNSGTLDLVGITLDSNEAISVGSQGGAIYNQGALIISDSTVINNTVYGGGAGLFSSSAIPVTISNSTFNNNRSNAQAGGAIFIDYGSSLTATDSNFTNNSAQGSGGGIFSVGSELMISTSTFSGNIATDSGGAVSTTSSTVIADSVFEDNESVNQGGAIQAGGKLTIRGTTFQHNTVSEGNGDGGGALAIYPAGPGVKVMIDQSTFTDNEVIRAGNAYGGAIVIWSDWSEVTITRSLIANNRATNTSGSQGVAGGGIANRHGSLTVLDTTLSGNVAVGGGESHGGAILSDGQDNTPDTLVVRRSTIVGNAAGGGGGISLASNGDRIIESSILAENTATPGGLFRTDTAGSFLSGGHNLFSVGSTATGFVDGMNTDLVGSQATPIDAKLGPLADNGGPTLTHALLSGSPAIDAGLSGSVTDQRGAPRSLDGDGNGSSIADIGAFETLPAGAFLVDSFLDAVDADPNDPAAVDVNGNRTLRAAIMQANATAGPNTIVVAAGNFALTISGAGEDAAASGDLDITDPLTLIGTGPATTIVDGNHLDRVFSVTATASISGMAITRGTAPANEDGGAIDSDANLTIDDCVISHSTARRGGGIYHDDGGVSATLTMTNCTIDQNTSTLSGGGLHFGSSSVGNISDSSITANSSPFAGGVGASDTTLTLTRVLVFGNSAINGAGGIGAGSRLTIDQSTIASNTVASGPGGGIYNYNTFELSVTDSTINGNTASSSGGGIYTVLSNNVSLSQVTVSGNEASQGGGIFVGNGIVALSSSTVTANSASTSGRGIQNNSGTVSLQNTIAAGNDIGPDVAGAYTSLGNNLIGDIAAATGLIDEANGDQVGGGAKPVVDPQLGPLQDNGGPTLTHLPLPGSPAIDRGYNTGAPATDQRGFARPQDGDGDGTATVDIGAVERTLAQIHGLKFHDRNGDGMQAQDGSEPGLAGWTIYLDSNNNGMFDAGEPSTVTMADDPATTGVDETGMYWLMGIEPGIHRISEQLRPGWVQFSPVIDFVPQSLTTDAGPTRIVAEQLDQNPGLDLVVLNRDAETLSVLTNDGSGGFSLASTFDVAGVPFDVVMGDWDEDGAIDLALSYLPTAGGGNIVSILWNDGSGTFTEQVFSQGGGPHHLAVGDVTNDGHLDLATATDGGTFVVIYRSDGVGWFVSGGTVSSGSGGNQVRDIALTDIDGDTYLDLVSANFGTINMRLALNNGDGTFGSSQPFSTGTDGKVVTAADIDDDGDMDLLVFNSGTNDLDLLINQGIGTFDAPMQFDLAPGVEYLLVTDLTGDGLPDVAVTGSNAGQGRVDLLVNQGGATLMSPLTINVDDGALRLAVGDWDGDTKSDLAVVSDDANRGTLLFAAPNSHVVSVFAGEVVTGIDFGNRLINEAPALADGDVEVLLPLGASDAANLGTLVANLTRGITDADAGALKGIAITATNETNGTLQYTLDSGSTWLDIGAVNDSTALLLPDNPNTRIRFLANGGFTSPVSDLVTFRAWDQTEGVVGTKFNASINGLNTAFSTTTDVLGVFLTGVFWDGGGDGTDWNDTANWNDDTLPTATDDVLLDVAASLTVLVNTGSVSVSRLQSEESLQVSGNGTMFTAADTAFVNHALTVDGNATLTVSGSDAAFTSRGAVILNGANLLAENGAILSLLGATSYTGLVGTDHFIRADGVGSTINLFGITSFAGSIENVAAVSTTIETRNGGTIDLRNLTSATEHVSVVVSDATDKIDITSLETAENAVFTANGSGRLDLLSLDSIVGGGFAVSGGGVIDASSATSLHGIQGGTHYITADGAGSLVDLSGVTDFVGSPINVLSDIGVRTAATNGGRVDLSAVSSLTEITRFSVEVGSEVDLRSLTTVEKSQFEVDGSGTLRLDNLTTISGTNLRATNGATIDASSATSYIGLLGGTHDITADGANSLIDLSGITSFAGSLQNVSPVFTTIEARNGGTVDLASVELVSSRTIINAGANSSILLSRPGKSTLDGVTLNLSPTATLDVGLLELIGDSQVSGGGTIPGTLISNATVTVGNSPGTLFVVGDYIQTADGVLNVEVGGRTAGTEFDQIQIGGRAQLDGTLNVSYINGFTPTSGDDFKILTYKSASGDFATKNGLSGLAAFDAGPSYDLVLDPGSITGIVFHDQDRSGTRNGAEPGLAGRTIYLDLNDNSRQDAAEPMTLTMSDDTGTAGVDETGFFIFPAVTPGGYVVRLANQLGWRTTEPAGGKYEVTIAAGQSVADNNFGSAENIAPAANNDGGVDTDEDTSLTIPESSLIANDTDPDPDTLHIVGVSPSGSQGGMLTLWHPTAMSPANDPQAGGSCGTSIVDMIATADGDLITGHYSQRYRSSDFGDTWQIIYQAGANCKSSTDFNRADDGRIFFTY